MKFSDLACTLDGFYACQVLVCVWAFRETMCAYGSVCFCEHRWTELCGLLESLKFVFPSGFSETYFLTQVLGCDRWML